MNNSGNNQPEAQDLDRARRLMEGFDPGLSPEKADDLLLYYLNAYKKSVSPVVSSEPSESTWESISAAINSTTHSSSVHIKQTPVFSLFWKAAAVILAAAVLVLAYLTLQPSDPELLARSGAEMSVTELFDGSVVTLRPYSFLYVMEESDDRQTYKIDGEAYFDVAENRSRIFTAVSGGASVTVTGTEFTLSNWSNGVRVYLESGSVIFATLDGDQSVNLSPGEYSVQSGNEISEPVSVSEQTFTGWLNNELTLSSRTVADVVSEVEHHFNITLDVPESIETERLSGNLQLQSRNQVLSDLALALNGRFVDVQGMANHYRFESRP